MAFDVSLEQPAGDQLPEHAAPLAGAELLADAVGAQRLVPELADLGRIRASQYVDQVRGTETLAGAIDAGQRLLCSDGAVPRSGRVQAVVAVAAIARMGLAEVGQQLLPPALGGLA